MELKQLRYFVAVAELGSFSAAAVRLNIAQSALSRQIANLEIDLGVLLFHRAGKRVRLAPAGLRLHEAAVGLLAEAAKLRTFVSMEQDQVKGRICLGADPALGDALFPGLVARLAVTHPDVSIDPTQGLTSELQELLMRGLLDAAILSYPDALPGCELELLARESLYFVAASASAPRMDATCTLEEALSYPLIVAHRPHRERVQAERLAKMRGLELKVAAEVDRLPLTMNLARQGTGCLILPHTALAECFDNPIWTVTKISDFGLTRYLARRPSAMPGPAYMAVDAALRVEIERLRDEGAFVVADWVGLPA